MRAVHKNSESTANFDRRPVSPGSGHLLLGAVGASRDDDRSPRQTLFGLPRDLLALVALVLTAGRAKGANQPVAQDSFSARMSSASGGPQEPRSYRNAGLSSSRSPSTTLHASITSS